MTIQEAINNVAVVVANSRMTQQEHEALKQSLQMIVEACKRDEAQKGMKDSEVPQLPPVDKNRRKKVNIKKD